MKVTRYINSVDLIRTFVPDLMDVKAIEAGAIPVTSKQMVKMVQARRQS